MQTGRFHRPIPHPAAGINRRRIVALHFPRLSLSLGALTFAAGFYTLIVLISTGMLSIVEPVESYVLGVIFSERADTHNPDKKLSAERRARTPSTSTINP
jgi:hypothetical protein